MSTVFAIALSALRGVFSVALGAGKRILLPLLTERFVVWLFFWAADWYVAKSGTTRDNELLNKVKEMQGALDGTNENQLSIEGLQR